MPQRPKGPRLWLRPASADRAAIWLIKDGSVRVSTGCGQDDADGASAALARYLATKHAKKAAETRGRGIDDVPIADVLTVYWQARGATSARPRYLQQQLARLNEWWGNRTVGEVTETRCREYVAHRKAGRSAGLELAYMKAAIRHAWKQRIITTPVPVWVPAQGSPRERWLTRDEMARLLWAAWRYKAPDGRRTRRHVARFILMARYTGTRAGAICAASLEPLPGRGWVDLAGGVYYRAGEADKPSNKRKPTIRLPGPLLAHLRRWHRAAARRDPDKPMRHVVEWNGKPVLSVKKAFAACVAEVNRIGEERKREGKPHVILGDDVTPHVLRHTAATWMAQNGADIWEAAGFLGMTREIFERVYGHHSPHHQASAHRALTGRKR